MDQEFHGAPGFGYIVYWRRYKPSSVYDALWRKVRLGILLHVLHDIYISSWVYPILRHQINIWEFKGGGGYSSICFCSIQRRKNALSGHNLGEIFKLVQLQDILIKCYNVIFSGGTVRRLDQGQTDRAGRGGKLLSRVRNQNPGLQRHGEGAKFYRGRGVFGGGK